MKYPITYQVRFDDLSETNFAQAVFIRFDLKPSMTLITFLIKSNQGIQLGV
jgi:hypothetical protein